MTDAMPNIGADFILEFDKSIKNVQMFGQAMEGLDSKFGAIDRRIDSMRSSLSTLSSQVSRGTGKDLRRAMSQELDNLVASNGIVLSKIGSQPLRVSQATVRELFSKAEKMVNDKLLNSFKNLRLQVDPSLNNGQVKLGADDFADVNRAIARFVRVQLNNLVKSIQKHGASMISAEDLQNIKFHIGKDTTQQIIGKVKQELLRVLKNPDVAAGDLKLAFSQSEMDTLMRRINSKVKASLDESINSVQRSEANANLAPKLKQIYNNIDKSITTYLSTLNNNLGSLNPGVLKTPFEKLSRQLRAHIAKEMDTDVATVMQQLRGTSLTQSEVSGFEIRRQFAKLEAILNRKLQGGVAEQIKELLATVETVNLKHDAKLKYHLTNQISRVNNAVIKKIRQQIDLQVDSLLAEINSIRVAPGNLNRNARIRGASKRLFDQDYGNQRSSQGQPQPQQRFPMLGSDPYARRDNYMNGFGLQGAVVNTLRHVLAGSLVGAPMMLFYNAIEEFKTSQLEQVKMFANLYAQNLSNADDRAAKGDNRSAEAVTHDTVENLHPWTQEASQFYAVDYGKMSEVVSIGTRLMSDPAEIKEFGDVVGKIYNIDREGDPVTDIAPGMEALIGQFDLSVGELTEKVVYPLASATNQTNATTAQVLAALMRSGSVFRNANVTPEDAIAMVATEIKYTGMSGENVGNFFKSALPRLQSPTNLKMLDDLGVQVYDESTGTKIVRPAGDILYDLSKQYERLDSQGKRDKVQSLFGTYQSAKGSTFIDQLDSYANIRDAANSFDKENFTAMMNNTLSAPIIEMQRAGTSTTLALASIMEELSPVLQQIAQGLTGLTTSMRENKESIAMLVRALGATLVGFGAWKGLQHVLKASGTAGAITNVRDMDKLYGHQSSVAAWRRTGLLEKLKDVPGIHPSVLADSKQNRRLMSAAMKNESIAPFAQSMLNMKPNDIQRLKSYMSDNNLIASDLKGLMMAAEESKSYQKPTHMTPDELRNQAAYNAGQLYQKDNGRISEAYGQQLQNAFSNPQMAAALMNNPQAKNVMTFLGGLDENGLKSFQQHLDDVHKKSGKSVTTMQHLSDAVHSYASAQSSQREQLRQTRPEFTQLGQEMDRLDQRLSRASRTSGASSYQKMLSGLSETARGTASAIGSMGKSMAGFGGQMLLFMAAGEFMSGMVSSFGKTSEEADYAGTQQDVKDFRATKKYMSDSAASGKWYNFKQGIKYQGAMFYDMLNPFEDQFTGTNDIEENLKKIEAFAQKQYGIKVPTTAGSTPWARSEYVTNALSDKGVTLDKFFEDLETSEGDKSTTAKARAAQEALISKRYEQMKQTERETKIIEQSVKVKEAERIAKARQMGTLELYDLGSIREDIQTYSGRVENQYALSQFGLSRQGATSDSEAMTKLLTDKNQKIIDYYQEYMDAMDDSVENLESKLAELKAKGGSEDEIKQVEGDLANLTTTRTEAREEFGKAMLDLENQNKKARTENALSRIDRNYQFRNADIDLSEMVDAYSLDRGSKLYLDASKQRAMTRIASNEDQKKELLATYDEALPDDQKEITTRIKNLDLQTAQDRVAIRDNNIQSVAVYRQDLQDKLADISNAFMAAQVKAGTTGEATPELNQLKIDQFREQIGLVDEQITDKQQRYDATSDEEERKAIKRELSDLERQKFQAQLGIIDAKMAQITMYRTNMQDRLSAISTEYVVTQAGRGITDPEKDPYMRSLKRRGLVKEVGEYTGQINDQIAKLPGASEEERKAIQREINDLKTSRAQAQITLQELRMSEITLYQSDMQDKFNAANSQYVVSQAGAKVVNDDQDPTLRALKKQQLEGEVSEYGRQIADQVARLSTAKTEEEKKAIQNEINNLKASRAQAQISMQQLRLSAITLYKQDMQAKLEGLSNDFLKRQVDLGSVDGNKPELNQLKISQLNEQVGIFAGEIAKQKQKLSQAESDEERKAIKAEIRSLEQQKYQAQIGVIEAKIAQVTQYRTPMEDYFNGLDSKYLMAQAGSFIVNDGQDPRLRALKEQQIRAKIAEYDEQIADQKRNIATLTGDAKDAAKRELTTLQSNKAQAQISLQEMRLSSIDLYKEQMNADLDKQDVAYLKEKVDTGITDENNPILRNFRIGQYNDQVAMFGAEIAKQQAKLPGAKSDEERKKIEQEIRDLSKQQYQAQLGILDELKNTGGTFNLPDGVQAMTYYEYMTRNNTHSTYTVQQGDTHVQITLPNVTDGTSAEKLKQIGQSIGQGIGEGRSLRPQMLANPYGYRTV